jgi:hypothetical protein
MNNLPESVVLNKNNLKIHSPEGYVNFLGVNKIVKDRYIHLKFTNGSELKCSEDHPISTINGTVRAKHLSKKDEIETVSGHCFLSSKRSIKKTIELYDIVNSGTRHLYYSNGIVSHNCHFLGSSNTLISGRKLQELTYKEPIAIHDNLKIYEYPIKNAGENNNKDELYCITVDVSEGKNLDASAFNVFNITHAPYRQVASYKDPTISTILFPTMIYNAARMYNDAYILVEINNTPQIADIIHHDLEYENLLKVFTGNKKPQQLSAGFGRGVQMGLKMSPQVKRIGCSNLKTLIEGDKLLINDFDTYSELTTFIEKKNSFAAADDSTDDLIMSMVIFAWATTQKYFREIVSHDLRKQLQLENLNQHDEELLPAPIIDDGINPLLGNNFEVIDGDVWEAVNGGNSYDSFVRDAFRYL